MASLTINTQVTVTHDNNPHIKRSRPEEDSIRVTFDTSILEELDQSLVEYYKQDDEKKEILDIQKFSREELLKFDEQLIKHPEQQDQLSPNKLTAIIATHALREISQGQLLGQLKRQVYRHIDSFDTSTLCRIARAYMHFHASNGVMDNIGFCKTLICAVLARKNDLKAESISHFAQVHSFCFPKQKLDLPSPPNPNPSLIKSEVASALRHFFPKEDIKHGEFSYGYFPIRVISSVYIEPEYSEKVQLIIDVQQPSDLNPDETLTVKKKIEQAIYAANRWRVVTILCDTWRRCENKEAQIHYLETALRDKKIPLPKRPWIN